MRTVLTRPILAVVVAAAIGGVAIQAQQKPPAPAAAQAAGAACPADAKPANFDFTLKDVDGKDVRFADYKGKVVLLDFWATWCVPCKVEIPIFIDLCNRYKRQGFEVVSIVLLDK